MPYPRKYGYIIILLINIQLIACSVRQSFRTGLRDGNGCDTTKIIIDPPIARAFPHIDSLLRSWVVDRQGIFQRREFRNFFASPKTRLVFSMSRFSPDTSAISYGAKIDRDGVFEDTIFLNKTLFIKASQEYLASVVIHEDVHAYITWCCLSFAGRRNGIDANYLRRNFHSDWLRLASQTFPNNEEEHVLMTRDFIGVMVRCLFRYTNRQSNPVLREAVAQSLTWGGLMGTPDWKELRGDTCYFRNVDVWARNMDADATRGVSWGQCDVTGVHFLLSLELQRLSK